MPTRIQFFLDPLHAIQHHKSCYINPTKSKLKSLQLESVYEFLFKKHLKDAHNSLNDVKAQREVCTHSTFFNFINKTISITAIHDIFSKHQQSEMKKILEPCEPIHLPWIEQMDENEICWEPSGHDRYKGCSGGVRLGVSSTMNTVVRTAKYNIDVFFFISYFIVCTNCRRVWLLCLQWLGWVEGHIRLWWWQDAKTILHSNYFREAKEPMWQTYPSNAECPSPCWQLTKERQHYSSICHGMAWNCDGMCHSFQQQL